MLFSTKLITVKEKASYNECLHIIIYIKKIYTDVWYMQEMGTSFRDSYGISTYR